MEEKLTPMLQQYTSIKRQHPDVILLFRLGDFYEMFGEDAQLAAPILDLVLTGRDAGAQGRWLLDCGHRFEPEGAHASDYRP
jgi:DNA mismatch repair protein MutS